jgi:hypothetical protein
MKPSGKRRRSGALEPLGFVLRRDTDLRVPASIETSPIAYRDWEAAVGTRIAARARPIRLERGVLLIRTATATWAQELSMLSEAIISQLRGRSLPVDSLRFRVGQVDAPERPPARDEVRTSPPEVPLPPALRREVERVEDVELREVIARAAAKNLGWQAMNDAQAARVVKARSRRAPPPEEQPRPPRKGGERAPERATSAPPAAPAPRAAGSGTSAPDPGTKPSPAGRRGRP